MSSNSFVDAFSPGSNTTTTTTTTTTTSSRSPSTVRSRPRRMVSFHDDEPNPTQFESQAPNFSATSNRSTPSILSPNLTARSRGATPSPYASRGVSPMPMRHPSRTAERRDGTQDGLHAGRTRGKNATESPRATTDLLDASWSSLQSLASSVLGSDSRPAANGSARTHARKPSRPGYIRDLSRSSTASGWGPSGPSTPEIGAGTKEERHAYVQAKKREVLLLPDSEATGLGHKRRDSCELSGHSGIDPERDEGALAYVHHVRPADTMTGVTIKYGCQPAVVRKANGFWPSDSIQSRRTVLLPVESCSVKGRPIPKEVDLLGDGDTESAEDPNGSSIAPPETGTPSTNPTSASEDGDRIWKHESYVQIDGFASPVEIGRVPRRALGFFPRTRRKSVSYTDAEPDRGRSPSLPISPGPEPSEPPSLSQSPALSGRGSAHRGHQRQRSGIQLSGPGVGTLDRQTITPGPALDGLSKFFAQHLPTFAPQTPPPSFEPISTVPSNTSTGLDNIGGAVEGWVRKMTTKAKASINELQGPQPAGRDVFSTRRMGDLIELDDARNTPSPDPGVIDSRPRAEFSRSTSSLRESDTPSLRERFSSPGMASRTRSSGMQGDRDRYKDD